MIFFLFFLLITKKKRDFFNLTAFSLPLYKLTVSEVGVSRGSPWAVSTVRQVYYFIKCFSPQREISGQIFRLGVTRSQPLVTSACHNTQPHSPAFQSAHTRDGHEYQSTQKTGHMFTKYSSNNVENQSHQLIYQLSTQVIRWFFCWVIIYYLSVKFLSSRMIYLLSDWVIKWVTISNGRIISLLSIWMMSLQVLIWLICHVSK